MQKNLILQLVAHILALLWSLTLIFVILQVYFEVAGSTTLATFIHCNDQGRLYDVLNPIIFPVLLFTAIFEVLSLDWLLSTKRTTTGRSRRVPLSSVTLYEMSTAVNRFIAYTFFFWYFDIAPQGCLQYSFWYVSFVLLVSIDNAVLFTRQVILLNAAEKFKYQGHSLFSFGILYILSISLYLLLVQLSDCISIFYYPLLFGFICYLFHSNSLLISAF